jgi:hypothetical protein
MNWDDTGLLCIPWNGGGFSVRTSRTSGMDLRGFRSRGRKGQGRLIARPRWLECYAPVQLTVGTIRNLRRTAEVEIRVPRFADRPAAVALLKVEKLLWSRGLLGFADLLGHVHLAVGLLREVGFQERP